MRLQNGRSFEKDGKGDYSITTKTGSVYWGKEIQIEIQQEKKTLKGLTASMRKFETGSNAFLSLLALLTER
jgi:hypothetical protein